MKQVKDLRSLIQVVFVALINLLVLSRKELLLNVEPKHFVCEQSFVVQLLYLNLVLSFLVLNLVSLAQNFINNLYLFCQAAFTLFKIVNTRLNSVYIDLSSGETSIDFFYLIFVVSGLIWRLAAVHSETRLRGVACQSSGLVVGGVLNDVGDKMFLRIDEF